ncbi:hypothetical protein F2Q69_00005764 [Brassica cretica]|uniref:Uncharacterized protein n=1 Tax=Brassica cretica TaxID=69181 RepID=A0A8S9P1N9_BRACR|nr:hypothetical protein F2Q69_00005764 [Brassica cretica]
MRDGAFSLTSRSIQIVLVLGEPHGFSTGVHEILYSYYFTPLANKNGFYNLQSSDGAPLVKEPSRGVRCNHPFGYGWNSRYVFVKIQEPVGYPTSWRTVGRPCIIVARDGNEGAGPQAWPVKACCRAGLGLHLVSPQNCGPRRTGSKRDGSKAGPFQNGTGRKRDGWIAGWAIEDEVDGEEEKSPSFCRSLVINMRNKKLRVWSAILRTSARAGLTHHDQLEDKPGAVQDGMTLSLVASPDIYISVLWNVTRSPVSVVFDEYQKVKARKRHLSYTPPARLARAALSAGGLSSISVEIMPNRDLLADAYRRLTSEALLLRGQVQDMMACWDLFLSGGFNHRSEDLS